MGCKKSKLDDDQNGCALEVNKHQPVRTDQTVYVRDPTSRKPHIVSSKLDGEKKNISFCCFVFNRLCSEEFYDALKTFSFNTW